jgi:O-antigen/teichoic acid export membrane protein
MNPLPSSSGRVGWRVSAKFGADVSGRVLLLGLFVAAARVLPADDFGRYAFALAVGLVAAQLADSGLQVSLLRRLSAEADRGASGQALGSALRARLIAGLALGIGGGLLAASIGESPADSLALAAIAVAQIVAAQSELWLQVVRAAGRLELEAAAGLVGRALIVAPGVLALVGGGELPGLGLAYAVGSVMSVVVARLVANRFLEPGRQGWAGLRETYLEALPLAVAGAASLLMFRIDVLLLQWLRDSETVGVYSAAYRPFEAALLVPVAIMAAGFPRLVRVAADGRAFRGLAARLAGILVAGALGVGLFGWLAGPPLIGFLFGEPYAPSGELLRILVLALPAIYLNALLTQSLVALRRPWLVAASMAAALVANVAFNLVLIPPLGATGAAIATVIAETTLLIASLAAVVRLAQARRPWDAAVRGADRAREIYKARRD